VYSVLLRSGEYLHVRIDSYGIDVALAIYSPGAVKLAESNYRLPGPKRLAIISATSGNHRLEVRALETSPATGHYTLEITDLRAAVRGDSDRVAAIRLLAEAESLRGRWDAKSSQYAILKYRTALRSWGSSGDVLGAILTLRRLGDTCDAIGQAQEALRYYQESWQRSKEAKDAWEENQALNNLSHVYLNIGRLETASEYGRLALELSRRIQNTSGEAAALNSIGNVKLRLGETRECLAIYNSALGIAEKSGDRRIQARTLLNIGYAYSDLRETSEALESYDHALSLWTTLEDRWGRATTLNALGHLLGNISEKQRALGYYREAREIFSTLGDPYGEGVAFAGMGFQYLELGDVQIALEYFEEQLRLHRKVKLRLGEAVALVKIGVCFSLLGDHGKALEYYKQALTMNEQLQDRRNEAYILGLAGTSYEAMLDNDKALHSYEQSWSLSQAGGDPREASYALNKMARVFHKRGRDEEAFAHLENALSLSRKSKDRFGESLTLSNMAEMEADRGHDDVALSRIRESLQISESLRRSVTSYDLRASYFASVRQRNQLEVEVLMRLHTREPQRGYERLAFEATERARARSLLDHLTEAGVDIRRGVGPELLSREQSLKHRLDSKTERLTGLMIGDANKGEGAALEQEIRDLTTQYDEMQSEIRSKSPHYAALTQPPALSVEEIQEQILEGETLLLEYALGEKRSYLWAVSPREHTCYELAPRAQIEEAARRVSELLTARQAPGTETVRDYRRRVAEADAQYWKAAARLTELVLEPVAGKLAGKRLIVVSDGALQYVPFAALPVPRAARMATPGSESALYRKGEEPVPMVVQHEIVSLPSASALAVLRRATGHRRPSTRSVAVLADPVFDSDDPRVRQKTGRAARQGKPASAAAPDSSTPSREVRSLLRQSGSPKQGKSTVPRLVSTRQEADAILAATPEGTSFMATGFDASRATAMKPELGRYRIVHFATHAVLNSDNPGLSGIILSMVDEQGRRQNGFLGLRDIYNLELPVDLVVLSACNSALGKDIGGEGLVGIVRGFMYAGASRIVASLWKVDDLATKELMVRFYRNVFGKGESPAAALRSAQVEMWREPDWNSPYYWAAFVLEGEWR